MRIRLEVWKEGEKKVDIDEKGLDIGGVGSLFRSLFLKLSREEDRLTGIIKEYVPEDDEFLKLEEVKKVKEGEQENTD